MFIPHNTTRPRRLTLSLPFLVFVVAFWTGLTIWAGYLASRHIDYWLAKANCQIFKARVTYFGKEIKRNHELMTRLHLLEQKLNFLLGLNSKKAIITGVGAGGPEITDQEELERLLDGKISEITPNDFRQQILQVKNNAQKTLFAFNEISRYINLQRDLYRSTPCIWPTEGLLTSYFGWRISPIWHRKEFHSGIDISNTNGAPLWSTADGIITHVGWNRGYGRVIIINHGYGYSTLYGHCSKILVKKGEEVKRGQLIALMGSTGISTGDHVHYEVHYCRRKVNPLLYLSDETFWKRNSLNEG